MSLSATLRNAMNAALNAAGDTKTVMNYHRVTIGSHDPATDATTLTETVVPITTFLYGLSEAEFDYTEGDLDNQKFIVNYDALGFAPEKTDYVVINGENWEVTKVRAFPGGQIGFIVFIRKT